MNRLRHFGWIGAVFALALLSGPSLAQFNDYTTEQGWQAHLDRMKRIDAILASWKTPTSTPSAETPTVEENPVAETTPDNTAIYAPKKAKTYTEVASSWPDKPKEAVEKLADKYGAPQEVTDSQITWYFNGPWKRTTVYSMEAPFDFPVAHTEYIEQVIDARVPADKVAALDEFNGSLFVDSLQGELTARGDSEEMNILTLNLAGDILNNRRSAEGAREYFAQTAMELEEGNIPEYTQILQFDTGPGDTTDQDGSLPTDRSSPVPKDQENSVPYDQDSSMPTIPHNP
jgi:hypothetical protein